MCNTQMYLYFCTDKQITALLSYIKLEEISVRDPLLNLPQLGPQSHNPSHPHMAENVICCSLQSNFLDYSLLK